MTSVGMILTIITSFVFGFLGIIHLSGNVSQAAMFRYLDYSDLAMPIFGACEIAGAVFLFSNKTNSLGAGLLLVITMLIILSAIKVHDPVEEILFLYAILGCLLVLIRFRPPA